MTISSSTRKAGPFNGNDATTVFPFAFKVFTTADIALTLTDEDGVETALVLDTDYSVALNADQDDDPGGDITYPLSGDPLATGELLTVIGALAELQPTELTNGGGFFPKVIERALDRVVIFCQQLREEMARTLKFPVSDLPLNTELPTAAVRANKALVFDEDGNVGVSTDDFNNSATSAAASAAAAAAAYDAFDDRFLGSKTTDPALDNDGDALAEGTIYYNSVAKEFRYYNGTIWQTITQSGNLQKLTYVAGVDFTAGVTTTLTLPTDPLVKANLDIVFDAAWQQMTEWELSGTTLTFDSPIPVGVAQVEVSYTIPLPIGTPSDGTVTLDKLAADALARLHERVSVTDFGASPDNSDAENATAFNAAIADCNTNGTGLYIPSGTFELPSGAVNFAGQGLFICGSGNTVLQFTGTGRGFVLDTEEAIGIVIGEMLVENLLIIGGPAITDGFYSRGIVRSTFRNIEVRECNNNSHVVLHGVSNLYENLKYSTNAIAQTTTPTNGLVLDTNGAGYYTADCTFINTIIEGFSGRACNIVSGQGNKFLGGTFEAVNIGLEVAEGCYRNSFDSVWFEANATRDIEIYGNATEFNNCYLGSNGVPAANAEIITGEGTIFRGGFIRAANMQATSRDTHFDCVGLSDNVSLGFTGTGTYTRIGCTKIDVNADISGYFNDIIGPVQQISFAATQVPSSNANTLDDYEEGTWTPVLTPAGGTITPNATYTGGRYTKVGNLVTVNGCIYVDSVAAPTGALTVTGLPFTSKAGTTQYRAGSVYATDLNATATQPIMAGLAPASVVLVLAKLVSGVASAMAADVKAASDIRFSITYQNDEI